jgi:hypothetical protein
LHVDGLQFGQQRGDIGSSEQGLATKFRRLQVATFNEHV